jgi:putative peptidoglycan lipid II flippase
MEALILVCVFVACLMPFFAADLLDLLFRRGAFHAGDVSALTSVVFALAGLFLAGSFGSLTANCFYSQGDTRTPTVLGAAAYTVAVLLRVAGVQIHGFTGIAWATSLGAVLSLAIQLRVLRRRWDLFRWGTLARHFALYGATAAASAGIAALATLALPAPARAIPGILIACVLYGAALLAVGGEVPRAARERVRAWLARESAP